MTATRKSRLPRSGLAPAVELEGWFEPTVENWQRIEKAYDVILTTDQRDSITDIMNKYVAGAAVTDNAAFCKDVIY